MSQRELSLLKIKAATVAQIQNPCALAFWVKVKLNGRIHYRLADLRACAKPWGFATARFNSSLKVLCSLGLAEIYRDCGRKWVKVV